MGRGGSHHPTLPPLVLPILLIWTALLKSTKLCTPSRLDSGGSSAGPGDHHVRSRDESWPVEPLAVHRPPPPASLSLTAPPTHPVWATRGTPTKTLHMCIPTHYKGQGLAGLSGAVFDLPDLPVRNPVSRHRAFLSSTSCSPAKISAAPITAIKNTSIKISEASQTNIGNSSIPADKIHRTLRHRKSARDLRSVRRAQLELVKMNNNHHRLASSTPTFDEMLGYPSTQGQLMEEIPSDIPRYTPSDPSPRPSSAQSEYIRSPFSLSAENLHTYQEQATLARPHSMSSLQSTPDISDNIAMQFTLRRASDPTDSTMFFESQPARSFSLEDYTSWMTPNGMGQQNFSSSIDLSLPTGSPAIENDASQSWWNEGKVDMGDEWAGQQMDVISSAQVGNGGSISAVRHYNNGNARRSPYNTPMSFLRRPPSPSLDEGDSSIFPHIKRSGSACSSMPSPPESPEFYFPSQMPTPDIGFPPTPSLGQGGFGTFSHGPSPAETITRRSSLPHTPSPVSHLSAVAAAAVALAATSSKATSRSISKVSSRPGSSRRKASSGSMRSQAKTSVASSLSSQSNESEMSFVNFTPHDASRILNGVAPSGSSKTKARREKEALDRRRKLSEAAAAAVKAVGGDASALANVDLLLQ